MSDTRRNKEEQKYYEAVEKWIEKGSGRRPPKPLWMRRYHARTWDKEWFLRGPKRRLAKGFMEEDYDDR